MSEIQQEIVQEQPINAALDFTTLIEEKQHAHFLGTREWLFDAVREWLRSSTKRLFWVVGDAGTGKSVISAKLLQLDGIKEHIVAWHFCRHDNAAMSAVNVLLMSWAAMLSEKLPGFELTPSSNALAATSAEEVFEQLIGGPLSRMTPPSTPCVIVLDALDELPKEALSPVLSLIANVFDSLPQFMRLFVTSRNQRDIVARLEKFGNEKLLVDEVRNKADLRAYLAHVAREHVDLEITTAALEQMLEKEFGLRETTLKDKLIELESLIAQSKYIYQEAVAEFKIIPEYRAVCKIRDIECHPAPMQTASSLEALYEDAALAHAKMVSSFAKGKEEGWVDIIIDPGLKTLESATRKVRDEYKGNFRLLKDLTRFTSQSLECSGMNDFLKNLSAQSTHFEFVALRNKYANPTALGYRDFNITLMVKLETGRSHLCELQVNLQSMLAAKQKAHLHYEKIRVHIPHICAAANITETGRFEASLTRILNNSVLDSAVAELELKAGGLFLYATLLAHQLQQDKGKQDSKIDFNKLYALPTGLNEIYQENFDRLVGVDKMRWKVFVPVIALIVATREPLAQKVAEAILGTSLEDVQSSLSVLFPVREGCFQVMHKSVVDWLRDVECAGMYHIGTDDLKPAHGALGQYLVKCLALDSRIEANFSLHAFAMRQVVYHLCEAGLTDQVYAVMSDFYWILMRGYVEPASLLADCDLAAKCGGSHQPFFQLLHSALKSCLQEWSENYQRMPGQLVGRLMGHKDVDMVQFLKQVRNWSGAPEGWWCPVSQTLPPAGGVELSVFKLSENFDNKAEWNSDETSVAWADDYVNVMVANVTTGELLTFAGHMDSVSSIRWSNDGKRLCSGSFDKTVRIWDVEIGECLKTLEGHTERVNSVSWSNDCKRLCSGSDDNTVRIWDAESGKCIKTLEGHMEGVNALSWCNGGKRVCSGSEDYTVRIWNVDNGECTNVLVGHTNYVSSVSWSNNGKCVCSGSWDKTVRIWDAESGKCIKTLEGHTYYVSSVSWSNDGRVCSGSEDYTVRIWDTKTGECIKTLEGHTKKVRAVRWSNDSKRVCSGSDDGTVRIWDAENGSSVTKQEGHTSFVHSVSWSNDGKRVCSGSNDKTVRVWNAESGECTNKLEGHTDFVSAVSWSSDGTRVCSASFDTTVRIWDAENGKCLKTLNGHPNSVNSLSWSSDDKRVCSGCWDHKVRVWDLESEQCITTFEGHTAYASAVSWSNDGTRVCSGSGDTTVRLWDVESEECMKTLEGHTNKVHTVRWSSDGKKVCSGSDDGTVRVWDVEGDFSFRTLLLTSRLQPVVGPVKFASDLDVLVHLGLGFRAVAIQNPTLHFVCRNGTALPSYAQEGSVERQQGRSDNESKEAQSGAQCGGLYLTDDKYHEGPCRDYLHRAWSLINTVHLQLVQGIQQEEQAARQLLVQQLSI